MNDTLSSLMKLISFWRNRKHYLETKEALVAAKVANNTLTRMELVSAKRDQIIMQNFQKMESIIESMQATMKYFIAKIGLIGGWDEKNENDILAISYLTGKTYDDNFKLQILSLLNDYRILFQNNKKYIFENRISVWKTFGEWVHPDMLKTFEILIMKCLDKRCPDFYNTSNFLKENLLETLVLLGVLGESLIQCGRSEITELIERCMYMCFQNKTWQEYMNLLRYSGEFAEADPDCFLDIIEKGIKSGIFKEIYNEQCSYGESVVFLIIALEKLMFIPEYQLQVCDILASLSELDPGGNWRPRALIQLAHIFKNHYSLPIDSQKQKDLLQNIKDNYPSVFWKMIDYILLDYIPDEYHRPHWRNYLIPENLSSGIENVYCEMLVDMLKSDISNVNILADYLPYLPKKSEKKFLDFLQSDFFRNQPEEVREPVWESLYFHILFYTEQGYAIRTKKWNKTLDIIEPVTPHIKYRYLYNQDKFFLLPDHTQKDRYGHTELERKQIQALETILRVEGLKGFWEFVTNIQLYWFASSFLCETDKFEIVENDILARKTFVSNEEKLRNFSTNFLLCRAIRNGTGWIDKHFNFEWDENTRLNYLLYLPFDNNTWERVSLWLQNPVEYWKKVQIPSLDTNQKSPNIVIQQLIECDRIHEAVIYAACQAEGTQDIDTTLCITLLETLFNVSDEVKAGYYVQKIISYLDKREIPHEQILSLEFQLLQKGDSIYGERPKYVWEELRSSPEYFCNLIKLLRDSNLPWNAILNIEESLKRWNLLPGKYEDCFRFDEFQSWLEKVKAISQGKEYEDKAMEVIGRHLTEIRPQESDDSFWLLPKIAELLDRKENEALLNGLKLHLYDPQEVHCVNDDNIRKSQQDLEKKAEQAEKFGYLRIADAIRDVKRNYLDEMRHITEIVIK